MRLEQVLTNVLSNADKYTPERGNIEINMSTSVVDETTPVATGLATDNGEGIDEERTPRLFELFSQAERSLARSQGGLGICLSLDVARRMREMPALADTPLIAITGYDILEARALSAVAGFDHPVCKPFNFDELERLLK